MIAPQKGGRVGQAYKELFFLLVTKKVFVKLVYN